MYSELRVSNNEYSVLLVVQVLRSTSTADGNEIVALRRFYYIKAQTKTKQNPFESNSLPFDVVVNDEPNGRKIMFDPYQVVPKTVFLHGQILSPVLF